MKLDGDELRKLEPTIHTKMNYAKIPKKRTKSAWFNKYLFTQWTRSRDSES
jgi:hypothetical protein